MQKLVKNLESTNSQLNPSLVKKLKSNLEIIKRNVRKILRNKYKSHHLSDADVDAIAQLESKGFQKWQIEKLLKKVGRQCRGR